jgi:hypothetical protein
MQLRSSWLIRQWLALMRKGIRSLIRVKGPLFRVFYRCRRPIQPVAPPYGAWERTQHHDSDSNDLNLAL